MKKDFSKLDKLEDMPRLQRVRKANDLIQKSRFDLSLQQQKIILYIISKIKPYDEDFKVYQFNIRDFCKVCGINYRSGKNYEDLKEQIKKIADKSLWVKMEHREVLLRWIEEAEIEINNGVIELRLNRNLKPFLIQLKENYTEYDIIYVLRFTSKYSIRLYELIKSIQYNDFVDYERTYNIEDLKVILGAESYKTNQHFRDRVLNPSVLEINTKSDKNVEFEFIRNGRYVQDIKIKVSTKPLEERLKISSDIDNEYLQIAKQYSFFDDDRFVLK